MTTTSHSDPQHNTFTFHGKFKGWNKKPIPKRVNGKDRPPEWAYTFVIETDDGLHVSLAAYRENPSRIELIPSDERIHVGGYIRERDGCMEFKAEKIAASVYADVKEAG